MAAENLPTRTWVGKRVGELRGPDRDALRAMFHDLANFLARPRFYNGLQVGDGTPPTRNAAGVWVDPPLVDVHAKLAELEARIEALEP